MRVGRSLIFAPSGEPGAADPVIAHDSSCTCSAYQTPINKIQIFGDMDRDEVQAESVLSCNQHDTFETGPVTGSSLEGS